MGQPIPRQHPAVVLRSHYNHLRALLVVALIALAGVTTAVVVLAADDDAAGPAAPAVVQPQGSSGPGQEQHGSPGPAGVTRYDGGPEEGTRGIAPATPPSSRYDGGPEEGTRGPGSDTD
jgi:hypothetical protein